MARYTGPVCKMCRREGEKLFLKGDRCYTKQCAIERRAYAPGQHGQGRNKKLSEYGRQLRTKQYAKRFYGVLEGPFRHYYDIANKMTGVTGENLLGLLETRLDNVVYRLGFASSRAQARQMVGHGFFSVNGRKVDIPSFLVKPGQVISVRDKAKSKEGVKVIFENNASRVVPAWLSVNRDALEANVISFPKREEIDLPIEETLIVELYSK